MRISSKSIARFFTLFLDGLCYKCSSAAIVLFDSVTLVVDVFQNSLLEVEEEVEEVKVVAAVSEEAKQKAYQKAAKILDNARLVRTLFLYILIVD